jgi:hypothetical protein
MFTRTATDTDLDTHTQKQSQTHTYHTLGQEHHTDINYSRHIATHKTQANTFRLK